MRSCSISAFCSVPTTATVAKRDDAIGALLDFVETVGDEDDADAGRLQFGNDLEQTIGLGQCQARSGFVHDHDFGTQRERLRDLDQLALGQRERGNRRVGLEVRAQPLEQGSGCATTIAAVSISRNGPNERGSRPKKTLAATSRLSNRFSS